MFRSAKRQEPTEDSALMPVTGTSAVVDRLVESRRDDTGARYRVNGDVPAPEVDDAPAAGRDDVSSPATPADVEGTTAMRSVSNGSSESRPAAPADNAVALAQRVVGTVQGLTERVRELEAERQLFEQQVAAREEAARSQEGLKQVLRETVQNTTVTPEDLQTVQRLLAALAKDPNHIMVLASMAQQAGKLTTIVDNYTRLYRATRQAPDAGTGEPAG